MTLSLPGLTASERTWIDHVRARVVPRLAVASSERARVAALVTWWALKEGVLDVRPSPWRHSLCGAAQLGDLETCGAGMAWQLGMSGIQPSSVSEAEVLAAAARTYPADATPDVLRRIARDARVDAATEDAIAASTGALRKAWLLRDPAISFPLQARFVEPCLRASGAPSWCFGSWETARRFSSSPARAREVIAELESYFAGSQGFRAYLPLALALGALGTWYLYFTDDGARALSRVRRTPIGRTLATYGAPL